MRTKPMSAGACICALVVVAAGPGEAAEVVFTGDADADFTGADVVTVEDDTPGRDVGVPPQAPPGTISGWDMRGLNLQYDSETDTLFVGIDTFVIGSDADGDGDEGTTSAWLNSLGGTDHPDVAGGECFAIALDFEEDGTPDAVAGVSNSGDFSEFSVSEFDGNPDFPCVAFSTPLPQRTGAVFGLPHPAAPDFEFTISGFSALPGSLGIEDSEPELLAVRAFMGSLADAGIGDDRVPDDGQASIELVPEATRMSGLAACVALVAGLNRARRVARSASS